MRWIGIAAMALWLSSAPCWGQMAESLKSEFHKEEELGIVVIRPGEQSSILSALKNPKSRVIVLQLSQGELDGETAAQLVGWVRQGHSLWFYDARLGPYFGFAPILMTKDQFTCKPETGELGGAKREGVATTALAFGGHVVNTGVGQVSAFLPKLGDGEFGAVEVTGDTLALLRFTHSSPAIAAMRREGRGLLVFKPLLWSEALSGDRFQSNLLEYSAGFQVPGPAGDGKFGKPPGPEAEFVTGNPAQPLRSIDLPALPTTPPKSNPETTPTTAGSAPDGFEIIGEGPFEGRLRSEKLRFETGTSSLQLHRNEVERIDFGMGGQLDTVHFRDGRTSKGLLLEKKIEFEISGGETRQVEKRNLRWIRLGKAS